MPELPEVETIRKQLSEVLPFKISTCRTSVVSHNIVHTKLDKLKGKTILSVSRKGKMLDFLLDDGRHMLSHLGMTGSWRVTKARCKEKHTHIEFANEAKDSYLSFVDQRRFGHFYLLSPAQAMEKLEELGADLLSAEFTYEYFKKCLLKYPERLIKVTLLDQKLFAGTGNYIASEICARGRVLPDRQVKTLKEFEIKKLYEAVPVVIEGALRNGGSTFEGGFSDINGDHSWDISHMVVFYQDTCRMCNKTPVTKVFLAQRGTYFCSRCQK